MKFADLYFRLSHFQPDSTRLTHPYGRQTRRAIPHPQDIHDQQPLYFLHLRHAHVFYILHTHGTASGNRLLGLGVNSAPGQGDGRAIAYALDATTTSQVLTSSRCKTYELLCLSYPGSV